MPRKGAVIKLDYKDFKDEQIASVVEEILVSSDKVIRTRGVSANNQAKKIIINVCKNALSELSVNDFTSENIANLFKNKTTKECLYIQRVLISLLKKKIIPDENLYKILPFKKRLLKIFYQSDIPIILSAPYYDFLVINDVCLFENLFFFQPELKGITPGWLKNILIDYAEYLRVNQQGTPKSNYALLTKMQRIITDLFTEIKDINDINRDWLFKSLTDFSYISGGMKIVNDLLIKISEKQKIKDKWILKILAEQPYVTGNYQVSEYLKILACENPDCFSVKESKNNGFSGLYIDAPYNSDLFVTLTEYFDCSVYQCKEFTDIMGNFYKSLNDDSIYSADDISYKSLESCSKFFLSRKGNRNSYSTILANIFSFFYFEKRYNIFSRDKINPEIITKPGIIKYIVDGYCAIKYNPFEDVPIYDKWILIFDLNIESQTVIKPANIELFDFTKIKNKTLKNACKFYIWKANSTISTKAVRFSQYIEFLNYINDLQTGGEISIYYSSNQSTDNVITATEIMSYDFWVKTQHKTEYSANQVKSNVFAFLHFLDENKVLNVDEWAWQFIKVQNPKSGNPKSIPDNELQLLSKILKERGENNIRDKIIYYIFWMLINTEFRLTTVLNLKRDCIQEEIKSGQYSIKTKVKTSKNEYVTIPISIEVKKHVDEMIKITEPLSQSLRGTLKGNFLCLIPCKGTKKAHVLSNEIFRKHIESACKEANISKYSAANIRDTHMTKAEQYKIRKHLTDAEQNTLTGHRSSYTTDKFYVDMPIDDLLSATYGVIIGNVDIAGNIVSEASPVVSVKNEVSNNCGYCSAHSCNEFSYLDCLMCKNFVTTPSRIVFFEDQIKIIDEKILKTSIPHDKEDLVNIKRLLVSYKEKIIQFKETN